TPARKGSYESFYLRAVSATQPIGVWIRHTAQKPPGRRAHGSLWCTVFDAARGRPFMHKLTSERLTVPPDGWIALGDDDGAGAQGGTFGPAGSRGACGAASWALRFDPRADELRHLPREWLYRAPLPRTKLTSPAPDASFDGSLQIAGDRTLQLSGWRGMVGHNWGAEHAERWIWLHGIGFAEDADAWLDVAIGRVLVAGRLTPWVANGALSLGGRRLRVGGLGARGLRVSESVDGCELTLPGDGGATIEARVGVPAGTAAGWRYADPDGHAAHDVVNCSIARLELAVSGAGVERTLTSAHGGAYELGMRERDHGVPIAPFGD
ncbi:MAG TPA: hypothetical protein VF706_03580, partial [Solirubrobacteraceae bacterium]